MIKQEVFLLIGGMFLVSYIPRLLPMLLASQVDLPRWLQKWMKYLPTALFSAILVKELFYKDSALSFSFDNYKLYAALFVALVMYKTKSIGISIVAGIILYLIITYITR